mgnify:CR=1 FL=1
MAERDGPMTGHEQWGSRAGFILATVGSAVGVGNIWRFSYVAGENGGAAFLLIYIVCVLLIGLPLVIAELAIGRRAQGDVVAAFAHGGRAGPWRYAGWLSVVGAVLILSFYAVIAGWALKYFVGAATGALWQTGAAGYGLYFKQFIANLGEPVAWAAAMLALTMFVVANGVRQGIETFSRILMPLLAIIVIALALYALTLEGAGRGVAFLFAPDWSALRQPQVYVAALGQAFFSIGVGMAIFITFGSYMPRSFGVGSSAAIIVLGDTLFAVIAGLAIFPAVFSMGLDPRAGPELAFITLPQIFLLMPGGEFIGALFFFLLAAAALTSMTSLLEVPVSTAIHHFGLRRWTATALAGLAVFLCGLPSAMSFGVLAHIRIGRYGILDAVDAGVSNFLLPLGGILIALFVGYRLSRDIALAESDLGQTRLGNIWRWLLRTLVPLAIAAILLQSASTL